MKLAELDKVAELDKLAEELAELELQMQVPFHCYWDALFSDEEPAHQQGVLVYDTLLAQHGGNSVV